MDDLRTRVARSLDAEVAWWPVLPPLLADLPAMGGDPEQAARLLADLPPGARVLDLGCGTGAVSRPLARAGARVTAVDGHEGLVEVARRRAAGEGLEAEYAARDLRDAVRDARGLDAVLLVAVGAVDEVVPAEDLAAALRPGGRLLYDWAWTADTVPALDRAGFTVLREERLDPELQREREQRLQADLRRAAEELARREPRHRAASEAFLARQEEAAARELATPCATWLLQRTR